MKKLIHIMVIFSFIAIALPAEVLATCASEAAGQCDVEHQQHDQHQQPCSDSGCNCICCGSISLICLDKSDTSVERKTVILSKIYSYTSLPEILFSEAIWQPPKLR